MTVKQTFTFSWKIQEQMYENSVSKDIVYVTKHANCLSFVGHILPELFGKINNWQQMYMPTSSAPKERVKNKKILDLECLKIHFF